MTMTIMEYNEAAYKTLEGSYNDMAAHLKQPNEENVQWIDISITNQSQVEQIASHFCLHHLTVEDILNTEHLPKFENFDHYFYLTLKMLRVDDLGEIVYEHISFVVGQGYVITFQEIPGDVFDDVRTRIIHARGNLRKRKSDYLFIRLLDAVVDYYGHTLEHIRKHIVGLEDNLLNGSRIKKGIIGEILYIKKDLNMIRSFIVPLREVLTRVKVESNQFLHKTSHAYLNDIQDHVNFLVSFFETLREMLKDLLDLHNTQMSNEMNHIMKTLTILSVFFIPLTFLAGLYGMNFKHMPELQWTWSYPVLLGLMLLVSIGLFIYMKRKRWM